jgi:hypothetical protein
LEQQVRIVRDNQDSAFEDLRRTFQKADEQLFENLRLFVERLILYRITRVREKGPELAMFARTMLEASNLNENPRDISQEVTWFDALGKEKFSSEGITSLFSGMISATETLDAKQLYYVLHKLRTVPLAKA